MRVVDLLNALQRFPGNAEVTSSGTLEVDGLTVAQDGQIVHEAVKGTKGINAETERGETEPRPRRRRRSSE